MPRNIYTAGSVMRRGKKWPTNKPVCVVNIKRLYLLFIREKIIVGVLTLVALNLLQNARVRPTVKTLLDILRLVSPSRAFQPECSPLQTDKQQLEKVGCKHPRNDVIASYLEKLKFHFISL